MINIIITVDYEIFGNGRGDINRHIIKPMGKILDICNKHSVSITIMFEVMEYMAFKKYDNQLTKKLGYSPKEKIEKQINSAYRDGHDVQLHIHPQFRNMTYDGEKFLLKESMKHYLDWGQDEVEKIITEGKKTLESIITADEYTCRALRLSNIGWSGIPENTICTMEKLGLLVHSLSDSIPQNRRGYWKLGNDIYEIPIHSTRVGLLDIMRPRKIFTYLYLWLYTEIQIPVKCNKASLNNNKDDMIKSKWDLSKLTHKEMIQYLNLGEERYYHEQFEVPLIMIGHTKDFFNKYNFGKFLKNVKKNKVDLIRFETMNGFIEKNYL